MAAPRIFLSSTYFDLRQIRADLDRFIKDLGYEPVLHERGQIPYEKDEFRETSAFREVENCDILVAIIGGKYGTGSQNVPYSITQSEIRKALDAGRQVYIFVDSTVYSEYQMFTINRDNPNMKYRVTENVQIHKFLDEIHALNLNNTTQTFENSQDIITFLKAQWAGLFQRFLQSGARRSEIAVLDDMKRVAVTLNELVKYLKEEGKSSNSAIEQIILADHPIFRQLASLTSTPYRVFFYNREEMNSWLSQRGFKEEFQINFDNEYDWWINETPKGKDPVKRRLHIKRSLFDADGRLKPISREEWNETWVKLTKEQVIAEEDDLPF